MAKSQVQKEQTIETLVSQFKSAKSVVFANFQGLKVKESEELRKLCRDENVLYMASKKTLVQKAIEQAGIAGDVNSFVGSVSVAFGQGDEVAPARVLAEYAKKHEAVKLYGGLLEGNFIDGDKVKALAALPTKHQLLGQLVGTLNAPVSGFVNVLAGNLRGLVTVLDAIKEQKA
jgi:large subunit ribosomal protein L10